MNTIINMLTIGIQQLTIHEDPRLPKNSNNLLPFFSSNVLPNAHRLPSPLPVHQSPPEYPRGFQESICTPFHLSLIQVSSQTPVDSTPLSPIFPSVEVHHAYLTSAKIHISFLPQFTIHISSQTPTDSPLAHLPLTSISTTSSSSYVTRYNGDFSFFFFTSFAFTISRGGSGTRVVMGLMGGRDNND